MKTRFLIPFLLAFIACAGGFNIDQQETAGIKQIRWLLGTWARKSGNRIHTERWQELSPETFRGQGVTESVSSGSKTTQEHLLLTAMGEEVFYIAKPGQNELPVSFKLVSASSSVAIFENLQHDFPKRIKYELLDRQHLKVTVDDTQSKSMIFEFQRAEEKPD
jgi:hypothetical protein